MAGLPEGSVSEIVDDEGKPDWRALGFDFQPALFIVQTVRELRCPMRTTHTEKGASVWF